MLFNENTQQSHSHHACIYIKAMPDRIHERLAACHVPSQITNHKTQISDHKSQISDLKSQISDHKSQISNLKFQISTLKISKFQNLTGLALVAPRSRPSRPPLGCSSPTPLSGTCSLLLWGSNTLVCLRLRCPRRAYSRPHSNTTQKQTATAGKNDVGLGVRNIPPEQGGQAVGRSTCPKSSRCSPLVQVGKTTPTLPPSTPTRASLAHHPFRHEPAYSRLGKHKLRPPHEK